MLFKKRFLLIWIVILTILSLPQEAIAGFRLMVISQRLEIDLGMAMAEEFHKNMRMVRQHPRLEVFQKIGLKLAEKSQRPGIPYTFEVIDSDEINAFACPGGPIFVFRGLLEMVQTEEELAAILAHEFAHIEREHSRKALNHAILASLGMSLLSQNSKESIASLVKIAWGLIEQGYNRNQEIEADRLAVNYLAQIGYHPNGMVQLLNHFKETKTETMGKYLSTHPDTSKRIDLVKQEIDKKYAERQFAASIPLPPVEGPKEGPEGKIIVCGRLESDQETSYLRAGLFGYPRGNPNAKIVEITSVEISEKRFSLELPKRPIVYLPDSNEYYGTFYVRLYQDKNKNSKWDQKEKWIGTPQRDFLLVYCQKEIANLKPGWSLVFSSSVVLRPEESTEIFSPQDFNSPKAEIVFLAQ